MSMNKIEKDRALEVKDFKDMYEVVRAYESICFDTYRKAKAKDPDNKFVKKLGYDLVRYNKFTPTQLQKLMDLLDKQ